MHWKQWQEQWPFVKTAFIHSTAFLGRSHGLTAFITTFPTTFTFVLQAAFLDVTNDCNIESLLCVRPWWLFCSIDYDPKNWTNATNETWRQGPGAKLNVIHPGMHSVYLRLLSRMIILFALVLYDWAGIFLTLICTHRSLFLLTT